MNMLLAGHTLPTGQVIQIVQGDITIEEVDAIVNAANENLQHGGGVARTISTKGGPSIQRESEAWVREHGRVSHARPAWTSGGRLPAKHIIHAVGPIWGDGNEDSKLEAAVIGSLRLADELKCSSIALPAISTGIFGFPKGRAARVTLSAIERYFASYASSGLKIVRVVLYDQTTVEVFLEVWRNMWDSSS